MQSLPSKSRVIAVAILAILAAVASVAWWYCDRDVNTAFLTDGAGAKWILDPIPPDTMARSAKARTSNFTRSFNLTTVPASAKLSVRAFRAARVVLNGVVVSEIDISRANWKLATNVPVANQLHAGTNELTVYVTNSVGPPAVWLRLESDNLALGTDESWSVSTAGSAIQNCRLASQPVDIPASSPLYEPVRTVDSLFKVWPSLLLIIAAALALVLFVTKWFNQGNRSAGFFLYALLGIVIAARIALFFHDTPDLHRRLGFDATDHIEYIKFIQKSGALPSAKDGWEMHQPPLYYLESALPLKLCGISADNQNSLMPLRMVNLVNGLIFCWLSFLCLRLLFPESPAAQAIGLLAAAFLPVHLYVSQYVTNDPLVGLLMTAAFYFLLRALQSDTKKLCYSIGIGLALGGAMLTKLTALPAALVFFTVLVLLLLLRRTKALREWGYVVGLPAFVCVLICGWYYIRAWMDVGTLAVPTSQSSPWWQDPGFRTWGYYSGFGRALISPLFSGFHSFADGIYSTLWGDGLISGSSQQVFRPPWNYDFMNACYLLSLVPTILALIGLAAAIGKFIRNRDLVWFSMVAALFIFLMALVYVTISAPWTAEVKAFYAFPVLLPLCAVIAAGWNWLAQKSKIAKALLAVAVLVWACASYGSYWIPSNHGETWRSRGITAMEAGNMDEAVSDFEKSLQLNPNDRDSHYLLAQVLQSQKKVGEAIQQYAAALSIQPDSPEILNELAGIFARGQKDDAQHAVKLAERACELTDYRRADMECTLALAHANAGDISEAQSIAEKALIISEIRDDTNQIRQIEGLIGQLHTHGTN